MIEEWKDLEFRNRKYKISSFGNIYSYATNQYIKQRIDVDGYAAVSLGGGKNGKGRTVIRVHRLVAMLFVENPNKEEFNEVNHIDFDRTNNKYNNLEWCTHIENIKYSLNAGRMYFQTHDTSGENNPNFGNRMLSKKYLEFPEYAKEKQGRPGTRNGRCVKTRMVSEDGTFEKTFNYIRECVDYIIQENISNRKKESIAVNVSDCIHGKKDSYLGFFFYQIK